MWVVYGESGCVVLSDRKVCRYTRELEEIIIAI